jgi:hypothetical protein
VPRAVPRAKRWRREQLWRCFKHLRVVAGVVAGVIWAGSTPKPDHRECTRALDWMLVHEGTCILVHEGTRRIRRLVKGGA